MMKKEELVEILKGREVPWFSPRRIARDKGIRTTQLNPLLKELKRDGLVKKVSRKTWVVIEWPETGATDKDAIAIKVKRLRRIIEEKTL